MAGDWWPQVQLPGPIWVPPFPAPVGCICPAGANLACERSDCPRKPLPTQTEPVRFG